jgi:deoxycytidylate deaminase
MPWYDNLVAGMANIPNPSGLGSRHEATILIGRKPIVSANNSDREFVFGRRVPSTHAEVNVIRRTRASRMYRGRDIRGAVILVIRRNAKLDLCNSRPCNRCLDLMRQTGIRAVVYSNCKGEIIRQNIDDISHDHDYYSHGFYNQRYTRDRQWRVPQTGRTSLQQGKKNN